MISVMGAKMGRVAGFGEFRRGPKDRPHVVIPASLSSHVSRINASEKEREPFSYCSGVG